MVLKLLLLLFVSAVFCQLFEGDQCYKDGDVGVCRSLRQCKTALEDFAQRKIPQDVKLNSASSAEPFPNYVGVGFQSNRMQLNTSIIHGTTYCLFDLHEDCPSGTCSYEKEVPIVCCVERGSTTGRQPPPSPPRTPLPAAAPPVHGYNSENGCKPLPKTMTPLKTGQKAFDKCIDYQLKYVYPCERGVDLLGGVTRQYQCHHATDKLIIGGTSAEKYEFPHMVMLGYGESTSIDWNCGGTIISERFILTAGHCISTDGQVPVSHIVIGALSRSDANDKSRIYKVKKIIPHPQYASPLKYNDIALLETEKVMKLTQFTVPACLHTGDVVNDTKVIAAGWGLTHAKDKQLSDSLMRAVLWKFSTRECAAKYGHNRHIKQGFDHSTMSCYGDRDPPKMYQDRFENKDTCQGDSGGPIQIKDAKIFCMYTIVGVTSFGGNCGDGALPGVYTKVSEFLPWIESIVWPN